MISSWGQLKFLESGIMHAYPWHEYNWDFNKISDTDATSMPGHEQVQLSYGKL